MFTAALWDLKEAGAVEVALEKTCTKCATAKPCTSFYKDKRAADGLMYWCKPCSGGSETSRRKKATVKTRDPNTFYNRDDYLWKKYGITTTQYAEILFLQGGVCAICKQPGKILGHLHVDHNHVTGTIRGLLCSPCNTGIGLLGDSVETLQAAVEYLTRSSE